MSWKSIPGFSRYEVSDVGQVRVSPTKHLGHYLYRGRLWVPKQAYRGYFLTPFKEKSGYLNIGLVRDKKEYKVRVHRLVAMAFFGRKPGLVVNHKNGKKSDNRVKNLEWCTPAQNSAHAVKTGLTPRYRPETCFFAKLTWQRVRQLRAARKRGVTFPELARRFGVSKWTAANVARGVSWRTC